MASSSFVSEACNSRTISEIFDDGLDIFNNLAQANEPTNGDVVQARIKKAIHLFEACTKLVSLAGMFSSNESIDEVATKDVKFLLLPALLGTLTLKLCVQNRIDVVNVAEAYFKDFLKRCKSYGVIEIDLHVSESDESNGKTADTSTNQQFSLTKMVCHRNAKIQRFREQQELEHQLADLKKSMSNLNVDEETKRNYYLTLVKSFASQAVDEIDCLNAEKPLIEHMAKVKSGMEEKPNRGKQPPSRPLMPIIITRDELQKQVFGAGYPSLPTMTVQEFYDKRVRDGDFPDPNAAQQSLQDMATEEAVALKTLQEEVELEKKGEEDDPELLQQKRDMDEFKDTHRRGFGNRMNRS